MRFVDHDQTHLRHQLTQSSSEARIAEPFGRDQQHVEPVRVERGEDAVPVVDVRGVDRRRAQSRPFGGGDLIAHQREQW